MNPNRTPIIVAVIIILLGLGWLLNTLDVITGVDWLWTLGLAVAGVLSLIGGIDKWSFVIGPFFLIASVFSVLRQTGKLNVNVEVPSLVIVFGVLLLLGQVLKLPNPPWLDDANKDKPAGKGGDGAGKA